MRRDEPNALGDLAGIAARASPIRPRHGDTGLAGRHQAASTRRQLPHAIRAISAALKPPSRERVEQARTPAAVADAPPGSSRRRSPSPARRARADARRRRGGRASTISPDRRCGSMTKSGRRNGSRTTIADQAAGRRRSRRAGGRSGCATPGTGRGRRCALATSGPASSARDVPEASLATQRLQIDRARRSSRAAAHERAAGGGEPGTGVGRGRVLIGTRWANAFARRQTSPSGAAALRGGRRAPRARCRPLGAARGGAPPPAARRRRRAASTSAIVRAIRSSPARSSACRRPITTAASAAASACVDRRRRARTRARRPAAAAAAGDASGDGVNTATIGRATPPARIRGEVAVAGRPARAMSARSSHGGASCDRESTIVPRRSLPPHRRRDALRSAQPSGDLRARVQRYASR